MRGTYAPESKTLTFDFISATNLKSADDGHMHHAVYVFLDDNHIKQTWTFRKNQRCFGGSGLCEEVRWCVGQFTRNLG